MTKNIYIIINFLAIAAIIFVGVNTFTRVIEAKLDQPSFENPSEIKKPDESKKRVVKSRRDYDVITRSSIFGKIAEEESGPAEPDPTEILEPTSLNIELLATAVAGRDHSVAIISDRSKRPPEASYYIGDSVKGALIKDIRRKKVVLNINGKDEILEMAEEQTSTGSAGPARSAPIREPVPSASSAPLARTINLKRDDLEKELSNLENLLTQASIQQHYTDGEPDGLAVTGVKAGSVFRKIGLRNGDIVKSVEGNEIKSPEELISLYNDLQSADSVSFQILRRGREYDIDLNIK